MGKDKLENAALTAAANYDNPFDEPAYDKKFYDGFLAGAQWMHSQPLSGKVTEIQKEHIKSFYDNPGFMRPVRNIVNLTLELIFSDELFNDQTDKQ